MMLNLQPDIAVNTVSALIQLAVAPVFLIAGVGAILGVFSQRLARIIDRIEKINGKLQSFDSRMTAKGLSSQEQPVSQGVYADFSSQELLQQQRFLQRRARNMNRAILLCSSTGLLVAAVIMILFLSAFFAFDSAGLIAALFISAMISFMLGLTLFLREIFMATYFTNKRYQ